MAGSMTRVTADTNVILGLPESHAEAQACREIFALAKEGKIDLAVTRMVDFDDARGNAMRQVIRGIRGGYLQEIPEVFRSIYAYPQNPPWVEPDERLEETIIRCLKPRSVRPWRKLRENDRRDVDHLMAHARSQRDIFVTCDTGLCKRRDCLSRLGIRVMKPSEFLRTWHERST